MKTTLTRVAGALLLAGLLWSLPAPAQVADVPPFRRDDPLGAPPPVPGADDPEVQARGPVHEGYAMPPDGFVKESPVAPKAPPEPIAEIPPEEKPEGEGVIWLPGYWMWDEDKADFLWVSGFWRVAPPGRKWVPGYWAEADGGYRWVSGLWAAADAEELPYTETPPVPLDVGPSMPAPDEFSTYVPGIWVYRDRWLWRPGFWLPQREDWIYCPPRWCWTPRGFLFCGGYWDRPLGGRGVLFAPVYFGRFHPRAWTPRFVVGVNPLLGSLWVRRGHGYAFGDFYGSGYGRRGYQAWATTGPRHRDPLYSYYRYQNRRNPGWAAGLRTTHEARVRTEAVRPPRTLAAQDRRKDAAVLERVDRYRPEALKMTRLTAAERTQREAVASRLTRSATERRTLESRKTTAALPTRDIPSQRPMPKLSSPGRPTGPRVDAPRPTTPKVGSPVRPTTPKVDAPARPTTPKVGSLATPTRPSVTPPRVDTPTRPSTPTRPTVTPPRVDTPARPTTPPRVSPMPRPTTPTPPRYTPPTPRPSVTPPRPYTPTPRYTPPATPRPSAPRYTAPYTPRYTPAPRYTPSPRYTPAPRYTPPRVSAPRPSPAPSRGMPRAAPPRSVPGRRR